MKSRVPLRLLVAALLLVAMSGRAEQMQRFGAWEVHYVVLPSGFLKPDVAARYSIVRGRDRAFVNVSVLDAQGVPAEVGISGHSTNLLGQQQELAFRKASEGTAVYYLAELKHSNQEVLRFKINVIPPGGQKMLLEFQQKLYWEEP